MRERPTANPANRFASTTVEYDPGDGPPPSSVTLLQDHSRSILSHNDSPDLGFSWSCNPYRGCVHACAYCGGGETPVLMADGTTRMLADVEVGDRVIGTYDGGAARFYYLMGVAPREEALKLVCVLPLLPLLLIRGNRLEMLTVSAAAGLGFAVEENLHVFAFAGAANALGRFLTASFFHVAATGVLGLALCEIFTQPLRKLPAFVFIFCAVAFAHGCYDAFLASHEWFGLVLISMLSFLLLALAFFRTLRVLRDPAADQVALPATFIGGVAVLIGLSLICVSADGGFASAVRSVGHQWIERSPRCT